MVLIQIHSTNVRFFDHEIFEFVKGTIKETVLSALKKGSIACHCVVGS